MSETPKTPDPDLPDLYVWSVERYWDATDDDGFPCNSCSHRRSKMACPYCRHHTQNKIEAR